MNETTTRPKPGRWLAAAPMVLVLALVLVLFPGMSGKAKAAETFQDGIYTVSVAYGEATITAVENPSGALVIPDTLAGYPVLYLKDSLFVGCSGLTSVTIPDGVVSIGKYAFSSCTKLTSVTLPDSIESIGIYAFSGCTKLASIDLPGSLRDISDYMFSGAGLTRIDIPSGVKTIGAYAFKDCDELISVTISSSVTSIGNEAFAWLPISDLTIEYGVKTIGDFAFRGCWRLKTLVLPDSVTDLGKGVFLDCSALKEVTLSKNLFGMGQTCFSNTALTSITIPESLEWTGKWVFSGCDSLEAIYCLVDEQPYGFGRADPNDMDAAGWHGRWGTDTVVCWGCLSQIPTVTAAKDGNNAVVSWTYYKQCAGFQVEKWNGSEWLDLGITTERSFTDDDFPLGVAVRYRVRPYVPGYFGEFGESNELFTMTAPADVTAKGLTTGGIKVSWGLSEGATKYNVYRKVSGGSWANIGYSRGASYTDTTAEAGTVYYYRVRAQVSKNYSPYSANASARWLAAPASPTLTNSTAGVKVTWSEVNGASLYYVWRAEGNGSFKKLAECRTMNYTDKTAKSGVTYRYAIKARYSSTYSAQGAESKTMYLAAPTMTIKAYASGIKVTWETVPGATLYNVYRAAAGGSYAKIGTSRTLGYVDRTAASGKTYSYYVVAQYSSYKSSHNAAVTATAK